MSLPMAAEDFLPVALFLAASMTLLHDLYHMMSKGAFALLASGLLGVFIAGFYKALWKLLFSLGVCDFYVLNTAFFPMQSTGFMLGGIGMTGLLFFKQKKSTAYAAAAVLFKGTMVFVSFTILGTAAIWGGLAFIASKMQKKNIMAVFMVSFVCMLTMGYLSSKDFSLPAMNWIAEGVNILGMSLFLFGVRNLHKAGPETFEPK